jgi:ribosomal protein S27AE
LKPVTLVAATLTVLWVLGMIVPSLGIDVGTGLGLVSAVVAIIGVMSWKQGKSPVQIIKDWFAGLKKSEDDDDDDDSDTGDDDDDDDAPALPEHLEMVTDVNAEGKPVSVIALKKSYCPADLVPTLVYVKSADGKHEVPLTVLKKPLKPADIPADKKVSALNIAIPKAPAKVKCSTAGCIGEGLPGKHCPECGAKFVAAAPKEVKCSKPGCTGKGQPGKFCPECGTKFA